MKFVTLFLLCSFFFTQEAWSISQENMPYDLTLVGFLDHESLAKFPALWIDNLADSLKINFIATTRPNLDGASDKVKEIALAPFKTAGNVAVLLDSVWNKHNNWSAYVPSQSTIKIAYCMFEGTKLPPQWVAILNAQFDAVVVGDPFWVPIYQLSGVVIPIFSLPAGLFLDALLAEPQKENPGKPFTFGISAVFWARKNHRKLLQAFAEEFGNSDMVQLKMHGRAGLPMIISEVENYIKDHKLSNVHIEVKKTNPQEFDQFMRSLDCYVLVSTAEGYSISPREAMARGIPCILSRNTAHITLCESRLVRCIRSFVLNRAEYEEFGSGDDFGYTFNCEIADIRRALRDVYENYAAYLEKAKKAREWVRQQCAFSGLKAKYLSLIKPQKVMLGSGNKLEDDALITNSEKLYSKYQRLINDQAIIEHRSFTLGQIAKEIPG